MNTIYCILALENQVIVHPCRKLKVRKSSPKSRVVLLLCPYHQQQIRFPGICNRCKKDDGTTNKQKWGTNSEDSMEQILLDFFKGKENNLTQSPQLQYVSLSRCLQ
jgi:hypothetical protein